MATFLGSDSGLRRNSRHDVDRGEVLFRLRMTATGEQRYSNCENSPFIPRGTPAHGVVTWRTGKGAFGKSAKMEYAFKSLELKGQRVPLIGQFREEGRGNTGAAVGAAVAVGVFSAFVTGKSAVVAQGQELKVHTGAPVPVLAPAGAPTPQPAVAPAAAAVPVTTTATN